MVSHIDRISVQTKVWLERHGKPVFGIGKLGLFKAIKMEGSISKASKKMNISFRRAWNLLNSTEKNFGIPLLEKYKGGKGGGSSGLTKEAEELVSKFEMLSTEVKAFAERRFKEIFISSIGE